MKLIAFRPQDESDIKDLLAAYRTSRKRKRPVLH
jgi:hypothetical protein